MTEEPGKCEVCGAPATCFVQDVYETYSMDGRRHLSSAGSHLLCDEHVRESHYFACGPIVVEANEILDGDQDVQTETERLED